MTVRPFSKSGYQTQTGLKQYFGRLLRYGKKRFSRSPKIRGRLFNDGEKVWWNHGKSELDHITGRDPVMKTLAERFGYLEKGMTEDVFVALVESIVGQMLSNKAAGTLCGG